jgi:hypothetical protein
MFPTMTMYTTDTLCPGSECCVQNAPIPSLALPRFLFWIAEKIPPIGVAVHLGLRITHHTPRYVSELYSSAANIFRQSGIISDAGQLPAFKAHSSSGCFVIK